MAASLPIPGPVNLYACGGLEVEPTCRLAVAGMDYIEADAFGLDKLSGAETPAGRTAVTIDRVASGSVAERAGLKEGDLVSNRSGPWLSPWSTRGIQGA
jgi:hypothetical protein